MKKEYIFLGIVIVLLVSYLVLHDTNRSQYKLPEMSELAEKDISKVEVTTGEAGVTLTRKADDWFIGEKAWPADAAKVKPMLTAIADLRLSALVSAAKAYERYDLTDDKKIVVAAWAGEKEARRFDMGKAADTYQHTFVKLPGDPNVYHAMKNFRRTFELTADAMRDKKVLAATPEKITEIKWESADNTVTFKREEVPVAAAEEAEKAETSEKTEEAKPAVDDKATEGAPAPKTETVWRNAAGEDVDMDAIKRFLSKFSNMRCESYVADKAKDDFSSPATTVTLVGEKTYTLSLFEKKESDDAHPAVSSENDYPFLLQEYIVEGIQKEMDTLLGVKKES